MQWDHRMVIRGSQFEIIICYLTMKEHKLLGFEMVWDSRGELSQEIYKQMVVAINWRERFVWSKIIAHRCWNVGRLRREVRRVLSIDAERVDCIGIFGVFDDVNMEDG
jgi:hypothetical protein